jgi:hypothetical protein
MRPPKNYGVIVDRTKQAIERNLLPPLNYKEMAKICRMKIKDFHAYGEKYTTKDGVFYYKDNGADILAVAHLDSVLGFHHFQVLKLSTDTKIFCSSLDDRLGAYVILKYLSKLGLKYDMLLTEGEEKGASTAAWFNPPAGKKYKWMFSFDRRGTGAVTYQYRSMDLVNRLRDVGLSHDIGQFSDICFLEHLNCKGINFGVGYQDYHSIDAWASKKDLLSQISAFIRFYRNNANEELFHMGKINTFSLYDGFSYNPSSKSEIFSETEYKAGILLYEEAQKEIESVNFKETKLNAERLLQKMDAKMLRQMMRQRELYPERNSNLLQGKGPLVGSEDRQLAFDYASSIDTKATSVLEKVSEIVHDKKDMASLKDITSIVSPEYSIEPGPQKEKTKELTPGSIAKCSKCNKDYHKKSGDNSGICSACQTVTKGMGSKLVLKEKSLRGRKQTYVIQNESELRSALKPNTVKGLCAIKTLMPINFNGIQLDYRCSEKGDWEWVVPEWVKEKLSVGFRQ